MIYLDNNATTLMDPQVFEVMQALFEEKLGNPSSLHRLGQKARAHLALAQKKIADFFNVKESSLLFTSGATEALNTLFFGFPPHSHIITSSLEHAALLSPISRLEEKGASVTYLYPENQRGEILLEEIEDKVKSETRLIALMAANNETGIKTDIEKIAAFAEARGIFLLVDYVALLGKEPFSIPRGVSAMVFSAHKIHGPLGAGLAIIKKEFPFAPLLLGGGQAFGRRGGTENLPAIVGMAEAISLLQTQLPQATLWMKKLRDHFEEKLIANLSDIVIHGKDSNRLANTSSIAFLGVEGEILLMQLDLAGVQVSHGSACSSGSIEPSRVLLNMGIHRDVAKSTLRFSLSRQSTFEEIDRAADILIDLVKRLR